MLKLIPNNRSNPDNFPTLRHTALFKALPTNIRASLAASCTRLTILKNETLMVQNDPADWFYFILSGWVKVYRETQEGDEAVIELLGAGSFVGEYAFLEGDIHSSDAAAAEKLSVLRMPCSVLKQAVNTSHSAALAMLQSYAEKRQRQTRELESLKLQDAPQRIGCFILRQCQGKPSGSRHVKLPYGKSLIATELGMKGETFSRALGKLKNTTHVGVNGGKVHIPDIGELAEFVCAGCSNEYPCKDLVELANRRA
jgi:CRP/FNR family transcriptional regulator, dissimilatory nitrate respiration regulator